MGRISMTSAMWIAAFAATPAMADPVCEWDEWVRQASYSLALATIMRPLPKARRPKP
jgi:hypothetical protein